MSKILILSLIILASLCINSAFSQRAIGDHRPSSGTSERDPGSNRYLGQTITMDENPQFQIRKSMFCTDDTKRRFIVEIEKLNANNLKNISIQEYVDNTVRISNNSKCFLLDNASKMANLKNKLINGFPINKSDYMNESTTNILPKNNCLEAFIHNIDKEITLIYSFEVSLNGKEDRIEFLASTVVDTTGHPSTHYNEIYEIVPIELFAINAWPLLYRINTGDSLTIIYEIEYFSAIEERQNLQVLIEFDKNSSCIISKKMINNEEYPDSMIDTSINTHEPLIIELTCEFPIENAYSLPKITIKEDPDRILFQKIFDEKSILVEDEYPISLILSIIALIISAITGCFSAIELYGSNKVIKSNNKAMTYQTQKMNDINTTLIELKNELDYNLDRIKKRMP